MTVIPIATRARQQIIDLTAEVQKLARGVDSGVVWLHCPHTTAALTIQENADPDLRRDYLEHLAKLVPQPGFRHSEGNADAHIKASLIGSTLPVLIDGGKLVLGTWQAVWFVELDGPRHREVLARISAS
jgi:secondary thiamine-phosphate synthase enzyme